MSEKSVGVLSLVEENLNDKHCARHLLLLGHLSSYHRKGATFLLKCIINSEALSPKTPLISNPGLSAVAARRLQLVWSRPRRRAAGGEYRSWWGQPSQKIVLSLARDFNLRVRVRMFGIWDRAKWRWCKHMDVVAARFVALFRARGRTARAVTYIRAS